MTQPLTLFNTNIKQAVSQDATPPVYKQLRVLFEAIPEGELLGDLLLSEPDKWTVDGREGSKGCFEEGTASHGESPLYWSRT